MPTIKEIKQHGYYQKIGQEITVYFREGNMEHITGKLTFIGVYEIFLEIDNEVAEKQEISIFKAAIQAIY